MPHKLLIYPRVAPPRKYKRLLSFFEAVTGEENGFKLIVENVGEKTFPGGEIMSGGRIALETIMGVISFTQWRNVDPKLPPIEPKNRFTIRLPTWVPYSPGLYRVAFKIKSTDEEKIEYYQSLGGSPREDEWCQFIYVVDRHQLDLTLLLEQSLSKGE